MPQFCTHHSSRSGPVEWVRRHSETIRQGGIVLDLACGRGRHTHFLLDQGFKVTAVDLDISQLKVDRKTDNLRIVEHDLEGGAKWPFESKGFDGIVAINYLFRPLFPKIIDALAENGILIYQTFADGNEKLGKPRNQNYLLHENELLGAFGQRLTVIEFDQGYIEQPSPAIVQRICCINNFGFGSLAAKKG